MHTKYTDILWMLVSPHFTVSFNPPLLMHAIVGRKHSASYFYVSVPGMIAYSALIQKIYVLVIENYRLSKFHSTFTKMAIFCKMDKASDSTNSI